MSFEIQQGFLFFGYRLLRSVSSAIPSRPHLQARLCRCAANESQKDFHRPQRMPRPVARNRSEKSMLHRVPFRRSSRIMPYRNRQARVVRQFSQQFFPHPNTATVASARVRQYQQPRHSGVQKHSDRRPPTTYRINREPRRIERGADFHHAFVSRDIINSKRRCFEGPLHGKIVRIDFLMLSFRFPFLSVIGEIADKLFVFSVDADYRPFQILEPRRLATDQLELPVTVRMRRSGESFHVASQRKFSPPQPPSRRRRGNAARSTCESSPTHSDEFSFSGRRSSCFFGDDFLERLDDFGTFFSMGFRPPPGSRWRSTGRPSSPLSTSAFPRETQERWSPATSATHSMPPCPTSKASNPATCRFSCSFNRPKTARH